MNDKIVPGMVPEYPEPKKRRGRHKITEADLNQFVKQYGRKAGCGEPNDRNYSRELEARLKRMPPEDLDRLMRGEDSEV